MANKAEEQALEMSESDQFAYYLKHGFDDVVSFPDYLEISKEAYQLNIELASRAKKNAD